MNIPSANIKLLVVKVGTTLISSRRAGSLDIEKMQPIIEDIADLMNRGTGVILVSSGAIGAGMGIVGHKTRPKLLPQKQAAAAIGQGKLMHFYEGLFREHGIHVAQILLTKDDLDERAKYLNARSTLSTLLQHENIVPVVNENDTVAVDEIKFGDNDTLAAIVASKMQADLLVILSNVDGLYDCDPRKSETRKLIEEVKSITDDLKTMCGAACAETSVGGMGSKLEAARIAMRSGIPMVLANGERGHILRDIFAGECKCTYFYPSNAAISGRKRRIAFATVPRGSVTIDAGAKRALLEKQRSLLPSGIVAVEGSFNRGDTISVLDESSKEIARGLSYYSADEVRKIRGKHSSAIGQILGHKDYDEVIHRDYLVTL